MLRSVLRNLLLSLCSIVFALVVAEVVLRFLPYLFPAATQQYRLQTDPEQMGVSHPYIGHLHTPNKALVIPSRDFQVVHHTDGYGFRNSWPWPETADIVVVGDSLTFGYGVEDEEAWPAILAQELRPLRVVNLGLIGASPEQYVRVYETFGAPLQPKLLVVGLFPGNDFWDAGLFAHWRDAGGKGNYMVWRDYGRARSHGGGSVQHRLKTMLQQYTMLYHVVYQARDIYRGWRLQEPRRLRLKDGGQLQLWPSRLASLTRGAQPDQPEFQFVFQALTRLKALAAEHGMQVLLVIQPNKEHIYLPRLGETASDPADALRMAIEQLGMDYVDTTATFQQRAQAGEQLFFEIDGHPNRQGYRLIAHDVLAYLKREAARFNLHDLAAGKSVPTPSSQ